MGHSSDISSSYFPFSGSERIKHFRNLVSHSIVWKGHADFVVEDERKEMSIKEKKKLLSMKGGSSIKASIGNLLKQ